MVNEAFEWVCHPEAEALIAGVLGECCRKNGTVEELEKRLLNETSTRLFDWVDHIVLGKPEEWEERLIKCGFVADGATSTYRIFYHPGAQLPRVVLKEEAQSIIGVAVSVESIADFLMVRGLHRPIEGSLYSGYRQCCICCENEIAFWVVERRGNLTLEPTIEEEGQAVKYMQAVEAWQRRPRTLEEDEEAMRETLSLAEALVKSVGQQKAAWIVLDVERRYWQARNRAGQIQKDRQDRLGMGWANHDHHTFRSSRAHFQRLVRLFEILGFHCRERFYAGEEAGWGAQVMENSQCRLTLFLDVDLDPYELEVDFAHHPLPPLHRHGTIGLWCALHGDSILKAGMHHLEAQFMFEELKEDLLTHGVGMMEPFSNFSYLRQAFTKGEMWQVSPRRLERLLLEGRITAEEAEKFLKKGAVGSHMENLQRREGYKGFNQKNVSFIIKKTDPRQHS